MNKSDQITGDFEYEGDQEQIGDRILMHGIGTLKWKTGEIYQGDFQSNLRKGNGLMVY